MIDYQGKAALVTGAASGIGQALAAALAARGARVVLADIDSVGVEAAAAGIGGAATAIAVDLAEAGAPGRLVQAAFAVHGRLDLVCSNAGLGRGRRLMKETRDAALERLFAVNLFAGLEIAQAYLPLVEARGGRGRLMLTGSENSLSVPAAVQGGRMGMYGATKHALLVMAEWLRIEWAQAPVDLHILMPGAVYTPLIAAVLPDPAKAPPGLGLIFPDRCAELALKGMDLGLFYIPTHAHLIDDMQPRLRGVAEALAALGVR
jgi:NAD(P)-dependent dehydrogenase (short-subunit alcohol dehydrogenase family)